MTRALSRAFTIFSIPITYARTFYRIYFSHFGDPGIGEAGKQNQDSLSDRIGIGWIVTQLYADVYTCLH